MKCNIMQVIRTKMIFNYIHTKYISLLDRNVFERKREIINFYYYSKLNCQFRKAR